jgi:hypothetical protein
LIPESCSQLDSTCLFILQLACILNRTKSVWKKAQLRVFLCTDTSDVVEIGRRKSRLDTLLNQLRITATTTFVPFDRVKQLLNRPFIDDYNLIHYQQNSTTSLGILSASETYLKAANELIREYSGASTLCFLYLPAPPPLMFVDNENESTNNNDNKTTAFLNETTSSTTNNDEINNRKYMRILDILGNSLPPTMYVNGVTCVTSTQL